jgi:diadenosine tetraphosphate (Ap4A) HIT family hydrolase
MEDMGRFGDALLTVTGALRINYAMFGNLEPALHVHLVPRYADEAGPLRTAHPWSYDWAAASRFDPVRDAALVSALRQQLQRRP